MRVSAGRHPRPNEAFRQPPRVGSRQQDSFPSRYDKQLGYDSCYARVTSSVRRHDAYCTRPQPLGFRPIEKIAATR